MKKIAVITNYLRDFKSNRETGGGGVVIKNLLKEWANSPFLKVDVYCMDSEVEDLRGINNIYKVEFISLESYLETISYVLSSADYDAVIYTDQYVPYESVLLQSHSMKFRAKLSKEPFSRIFRTIKAKKQNKCFSSENKHFVAVSEGIKNDYASNFKLDEKKFIVSYPGTTTPYIQIPRPQKPIITFGIAAQNNLNKGGHRFLTALWLLKLKGVEFNAIFLINKNKNSPINKTLLKIFGLEGHVQVKSGYASMTEFYNSIDCLVMPSMHEAFGLVALEAAAHKAIPLVSRNAGFYEIIEESENAFSFDMKNFAIKNLSEVMEKLAALYKNDYTRFTQIRENSLKLAKEYTWKRFAKKVLEGLSKNG